MLGRGQTRADPGRSLAGWVSSLGPGVSDKHYSSAYARVIICDLYRFCVKFSRLVVKME